MAEFRDGSPVPAWLAGLEGQIATKEQRRAEHNPPDTGQGWATTLDRQRAASVGPADPIGAAAVLNQPGPGDIINPNVAGQVARHRAEERERQAQNEREQSPDGWLGRTVAASDARTRQYREDRAARIEEHERRQRVAAVQRYGIGVDDLNAA